MNKTDVDAVSYTNISWRDTILVIFIIEYNCTVHQTLTLLLRTIVEIMNISVMRCNE